MDKRKLRYARKKTKERILWQRSRRASQGSGQDNPQTQQEEKQVSPENYAEQYIERYTKAYAKRARLQGKRLLVRQRENRGRQAQVQRQNLQAQRKKQAYISSVLQEKGFVDRKYGIPPLNRKGKAEGSSGVKTASRIARGTKRAISTLLTGGSILLVLLAVLLPLCGAAAIFGSDAEGEIPSDDMLVAIARSQTGNEGGETYWRWYGFSSHVDWCAVFVSWCAEQVGLLDDGSMPKFAVCDDGIRWFVEKGRWFNRNISPEPGMIIFFDWNGDGRADHVGIVERCEDGLVYTVEGNSNDVCMKKWYAAGDKVIMGYGSSIA